MTTINEYNNALERYRIAYENYLSGDVATEISDIQTENNKLLQIVEQIKVQIQKNKTDMEQLKKEREQFDKEIQILSKVLDGKDELSAQDKSDVKDILDKEYNEDIRSQLLVLEEETRNEKLLKDLEEFSDKKKHTMNVLSIINIIFLFIIVGGLYLLINNKKFKIPNFNNKN